MKNEQNWFGANVETFETSLKVPVHWAKIWLTSIPWPSFAKQVVHTSPCTTVCPSDDEILKQAAATDY